jgi:acyl-CoA synthetase (AMP-forming)/AMP-acid ligase II
MLTKRQDKRVNKRWETRLHQGLLNQYTASGQWSGISLADAVATQLRDRPEKIAVIDGKMQLSFSALHTRAARLACALQKLGLQSGDVVSFQLPNWHEAMAVNIAASMGGFVCNPIVPMFRDAEVGFILKDAGTKALFLPKKFRRFDYSAMIGRLMPDLPGLEHVISVRDDFSGAMPLESLINEGRAADYTPAGGPDDIKLLLYTSGTTGTPKGVLHSHNTLRAEIDAVSRYWRVEDSDVVLMASPITHITGYLYALELPFACGGAVVLMDQWDCPAAVRLIGAHQATLSVGATPFLAELTAELEHSGQTIPSMRFFACGGAPVPPELILRAAAAMPGCIVCRVYGSSEAPTVSLGVDSLEQVCRAAATDGFVYNHDVKIVDLSTGMRLAPGLEGEIRTTGPELMLGYTDPAETHAAFDHEGYFRTGDIGMVDADGFITISGRTKDLIIRGGENISPKEIEDVLFGHPAIAEVAVVAMPHARMGETPAAFVVPATGATINFNEMIAFLEGCLIAKQKFPEKLVLVNDLPRNAAGKVQKNILRDRLKEMLSAASPG